MTKWCEIAKANMGKRPAGEGRLGGKICIVTGAAQGFGKGQEMLITLDGCVCVMVEEERYRIEQGDCIVFDANVEHVMYTEEQPATFVIISSPPYGQNILPTTHE